MKRGNILGFFSPEGMIFGSRCSVLCELCGAKNEKSRFWEDKGERISLYELVDFVCAANERTLESDR